VVKGRKLRGIDSEQEVGREECRIDAKPEKCTHTISANLFASDYVAKA